jgi:hypothetical protein
MKTIITAAVGAAAALGILSLPAYGAGAGATPNPESKTCVDVSRVDYTHVVDDQNILFYMYGGNVYLNHLSHPAPGLDRNRPFMHRTSVNRLCANDIITVLEDWGFSFVPGASTTLGKFEPIGEEEAAAMRRHATATVRSEPAEPK